MKWILVFKNDFSYILRLGWTQQKMFVPEIVEINPFSRPIRLYEEIRKDANPVS